MATHICAASVLNSVNLSLLACAFESLKQNVASGIHIFFIMNTMHKLIDINLHCSKIRNVYTNIYICSI